MAFACDIHPYIHPGTLQGLVGVQTHFLLLYNLVMVYYKSDLEIKYKTLY